MEKVKEKYKLLGSSGSLNELINLVDNRYFCGCKKEYRLLNNNTYGIFHLNTSPKAGQQLSQYRIIQKKGRFRFERLEGDNNG